MDYHWKNIETYGGFLSHGGSPNHHGFKYESKWTSMTWMICGTPMT